jgi:Domain of unknown function (DUF4328)
MMSITRDRFGLLPIYLSTQTSALRLGALLVLAAAVSWIAAGYDLGEVRTLSAIQAGTSLEPAERTAHAHAGFLLTAAQLVCAGLVAAAFVPWLYQSRCNLRALGVRRLRFRREWAYLGFLIPLLNTYRPYQVVSEVWRGSDPGTTDPLAWQRKATPKWLAAWWGLLLAWLAMELLAALILELAAGLPRIQLAHGLRLVADVSAAASASLGYFLVTRVSRAQHEKWRVVGGGTPAAPALTFERGPVTA